MHNGKTNESHDVISSSADHAKRAGQAAGMILLVSGGFAFDGRSGLAADAAYGQYLAAECATCHRSEGTNGSIPSLQFLPYNSVVAALKEYRAGTRTNDAMQAVARSLGDAEIEALAAYLSSSS